MHGVNNNTPRVIHGDCLTVLAQLPAESVDAVVTDPPYGLANTTPEQVVETLAAWLAGDRGCAPSGRGFMGHEWDGFVPGPAVWDGCMRVLKPGGHVLAFAGSRTADLMGLALRLAGFDIRDSIAWLYGQGFPKSLDVSRAVNAHITQGGSSSVQKRRAAMGADYTPSETWGKFRNGHKDTMNTPHCPAPAQSAEVAPEARRWQGWGTALKPAHEPILVARKPFTGTVAGNVLQHGTGALNIDATRIGAEGGTRKAEPERWRTESSALGTTLNGGYPVPINAGRWPANVVLDETAATHLDHQSGHQVSRTGAVGLGKHQADNPSSYGHGGTVASRYEDSGGASRFFYVAKASAAERPRANGTAHPTVKPLALMRWLCRLVTPPGGTVLDPFAGSGTTLEAAMLEGFASIGVEAETDYLPLIQARIDRATAQLNQTPEPDLFTEADE